MKNEYDEISPITGNKSVIKEGDLRICFDSGYHTYNSWNCIEKGHLEFEEKCPDIIRESKIGTDQFWFLFSLFSEDHVLIPKDGKWIVNTWRDREEFCEVAYEVTREMNNGVNKYIQVLDYLHESEFDQFENAYDEFQKRVNNDD